MTMHMSYRILQAVLAFTALFLAQAVSAQSHQVSGTVKDSFGVTMPGVGVLEKGSMNGSITDDDGTYSITVDSADAVLEFSFMGMKNETVKVGGRSVIDVSMQEDAIGLHEVIAIGYGSMKKEEITTSITRVKADDFIQGGVSSPLGLLQGKVAGLGMAMTSGEPNASPSISLRGISTLAASSDPLIVIDGIAGGSLNSVAPEDIESIDVLKDGSAAAIYGTRGTNGVIIINTKAPKAGRASVEYNGYVKFDRMAGQDDQLSAADYRRYMENPDFAGKGMNDFGGSTDWVGEITRNPVSHNHYLSIKGGQKNTSYVGSLTYSDKQGIYEKSFHRSLALKLALNHSMFDDRLRINLNINDKIVRDGFVPGELYAQASMRNPTLPVYDSDGKYYETSNGQNPVCAANEYTGVNNYNSLTASGKVTIEPLKDLRISATGIYQGYFNEKEWAGSHKTYAAVYGSEFGSATLSGGHNSDMTLEVQADYSKMIGDHNISATLGYSYNRFVNQSWSMKAYNFPIDGFGVWNIGSGESTLEGLSTLSSNKWERKLIGFFGRVNYNYANRYLVMASLRREGSDKFGANNRWGWFPSVSAGWRISNEDFMKGIGWIDELKLRAGYGVTGTEPGSAYQYISLYNFNNSYMSFVDGKWVNGIIPSNNPNPDLKWEEKHEANVGLDFSFLDGRLHGAVDGYYRHTRDLLYTYTVPTPPNISNSMLANVGSIMNAGVEVELNGEIIRKQNVRWSIGGNVSFNRNRLISLSNDLYQLEYLKLGNMNHVQTYSHRLEEGWPVGNFYGYEDVGLRAQGTQWRIKGAENSAAGEEQKKVIGNGMPKMYASLNTRVDFFGFDLTLSFRGAFLYQILNQYRMMYETLAWLTSYNVPKSAFTKIGDYYNFAPSTYLARYVEDGDFMKLDNITLGYSFDTSKQKVVKSARIYVTGQNLLTFTRYTGIDPEAVNITGLTPGLDNHHKYPTLRSVTVGVNISF